MACITLACFAPIPRGHHVRLLDLERAGSFLTPSVRTTVAIDLTAGTYYVPYALMPDVRAAGTPEMLDAAIHSSSWRTTHVYEGQVLAAAVSIKEDGDINDVWTRLFLTP